MVSVLNIESYGFSIRTFHNTPFDGNRAVGGIKMADVSNIKIGDVSTGNVIYTNGYGLVVSYQKTNAADAKFKST